MEIVASGVCASSARSGPPAKKLITDQVMTGNHRQWIRPVVSLVDVKLTHLEMHVVKRLTTNSVSSGRPSLTRLRPQCHLRTLFHTFCGLSHSRMY